MLLDRRLLLGAGLATVPVGGWAAPGPAAALAALERRSGGRLGVAVLDTGDGRRFGHRADERFPMCSTFKAAAAAAVLARVDRGQERLERQIRIQREDLQAYAPVTTPRVGHAMALGELCEAAVAWSDNTAANLILRALGGPAQVTAFMRGLGDRATRLDRWEPALNSAIPGDPRDTTTPAAMGALRKLLLGGALSPASRRQLTAWMLACQTAGGKLEAGMPADWKIGAKTGSGARGATNQIAIVWPPGRAPLLVCVYTVGSPAPPEARNAEIAAVGRLIAGWA